MAPTDISSDDGQDPGEDPVEDPHGEENAAAAAPIDVEGFPELKEEEFNCMVASLVHELETVLPPLSMWLERVLARNDLEWAPVLKDLSQIQLQACIAVSDLQHMRATYPENSRPQTYMKTLSEMHEAAEEKVLRPWRVVQFLLAKVEKQGLGVDEVQAEAAGPPPAKRPRGDPGL